MLLQAASILALNASREGVFQGEAPSESKNSSYLSNSQKEDTEQMQSTPSR